MDNQTPGTALAERMSVIFRGGRFGLVSRYGGGVSGLARFAKATRRRFLADAEAEVSEDEAVFSDTVLRNAWRQCVQSFGNDPNQWEVQAIEAHTSQRMPYLGSLDRFAGLDPNLDVSLPHLCTEDGSTILSQRAQAYTQFVPLHDVDAALSILPPGTSEHPSSPYRFSTYGDWSRGTLHPAPLSRRACEQIMATYRDLTASRVAPRRQRMRRAPRPAPAIRAPLPGRAPEDSTLEAAIRYLNRKERTDEEVRTKLAELEQYVANDAALQQELFDSLTRFIYIMRESQAGRMPILYGTPETLVQVEAFQERLRGSMEETNSAK